MLINSTCELLGLKLTFELPKASGALHDAAAACRVRWTRTRTSTTLNRGARRGLDTALVAGSAFFRFPLVAHARCVHAQSSRRGAAASCATRRRCRRLPSGLAAMGRPSARRSMRRFFLRLLLPPHLAVPWLCQAAVPGAARAACNGGRLCQPCFCQPEPRHSCSVRATAELGAVCDETPRSERGHDTMRTIYYIR